jgi:hypothetical protein
MIIAPNYISEHLPGPKMHFYPPWFILWPLDADLYLYLNLYFNGQTDRTLVPYESQHSKVG